MGIVYQAKNKINGKPYIGFTFDLERRKAGHKRDAENGSPLIFHRAIRKYGWDAFEWSIIYEDDEESDREWMGWWERKFIRELRTKTPNGYNMTDGGEGGDTGISDEGRRRLSEFLTGRVFSEETIQRMRDAAKGRVITEETARKISVANTGRKKSEEERLKISKSNKGKPKSEETKEKLRQSALKQFESEDARFLAGTANRGKRMSEEQKEKIRATTKKTLADPELRKAQSLRMKLAWQDPIKRKVMLDSRCTK